MSDWLALTRDVSSSIVRCELTHRSREPIDVRVARAQHEAYEETLASLGCDVRRVPASEKLPDSVFIDDMAVVLDEIAIVTRPGAATRRAETPAVAEVLAAHRPLAHIQFPATMDGGDVLVVGRSVFVGCSSRTNAAALEQFILARVPAGDGVGACGQLQLLLESSACIEEVRTGLSAYPALGDFSRILMYVSIMRGHSGAGARHRAPSVPRLT